jgi:multicomponent K+:H+ antiporter subunit E
MRIVARHPIMFASLLLSWMLLNRSWSIGQWLLGAVLVWLVLWWSRDALGAMPRIRNPRAILGLFGRVLKDIVLSNIEVAKRVLGPQDQLAPQFVWMELRVRDPYAIAMLAGIITMTPGTLSAKLSDDQKHLLIHGLNMPDPAATVADIRSRYEDALLEIFQ